MDTMDYWVLGNNVRSYRMKRGLAQESLAEKAQRCARCGQDAGRI